MGRLIPLSVQFSQGCIALSRAPVHTVPSQDCPISCLMEKSLDVFFFLTTFTCYLHLYFFPQLKLVKTGLWTSPAFH
jgi:hypothetical protein